MKKIKQVCWMLEKHPEFILSIQGNKDSDFMFEHIISYGPLLKRFNVTIRKKTVVLEHRITDSTAVEEGSREFKNVKEVFKFLGRKKWFGKPKAAASSDPSETA